MRWTSIRYAGQPGRQGMAGCFKKWDPWLAVSAVLVGEVSLGLVPYGLGLHGWWICTLLTQCQLCFQEANMQALYSLLVCFASFTVSASLLEISLLYAIMCRHMYLLPFHASSK